MFLARICVVLCALYFVGVAGGGVPYLIPSVGKIWPKPQMEVSNDTFFIVRPQTFRFDVVANTCDLLTKALARYTGQLFTAKKKTSVKRHYSKGAAFVDYLDSVNINLLYECEDLPYLHMDEHYEIKIDSPDQPGEGTIIASSIWGMLRGIESFSQLLVDDGGAFRINSTQIMDFPRFSHRGFLVDTSRHFLPVSTIKQFLELMSINKFNVMHWHIVDSQSFPYQSEALPSLSLNGAYTTRHVYTGGDMADIISYALERGIRVMPEFDTPGHTASWGLGQPDLLTECYNSSGSPDGTYGPIDPSHEGNYEFLQALLQEVTQRFPDHYIHLGGDEVPFDCWASNPSVTAFMNQLNITGDYAALEEYYITRLLAIVQNLSTKNGYLVWQEVFDNGVALANDTVVHIWKDGGNLTVMQSELQNVTASGFQTLLSSCWYLNYISYGDDWPRYYQCDPQDFIGTEAQKNLVVGGEACMWAEWVDRTNIIPRSWPRGSAVAEKLWSAAEDTTDVNEAAPRLEEHRCRMLARGFDVEPLWPSYCSADII